MNDPVYTLSWPRSLFVWEATRILQTATDSNLRQWTEHLLREAFDDEGVAESFVAKFQTLVDANPSGTWGVPATVTPKVQNIRPWLQALLADGSRLTPYQAPVYFAERHSGRFIDLGPDTRFTFAEDFIELVNAMSKAGYFPKIVPKLCADRWEDESIDVAREIRRATKQIIEWPLDSVSAKMLPELTRRVL